MEGIQLVVVDAFDGYSRGDIIDDPQKIEDVLNGEHEPKVRKTVKQEG